MKIQPIRRGESLPFSFNRGDQSIDDWTCEIVVKQFPDDTPLITGTVERTEDAFTGYLNSTQTQALDSGKTYRLYGILTNSGTDEQEQIETRFSVTESWAS